MRLALIQPKFSYVMPYRLVPLSLSVLGELSKGWDVDIIDANFDRIPRKKYDLIGITCSSFTAGSAYALTDSFREKGIPVVMGGVHPTFAQEEAASHADSVVTGEGEEIWPQVLKDFSNGKLKEIYHGGLIDMKNFPIVGHRFRQEKPAFYVSMPLLVQASRGCAHNCDFCTVSKFSGKKIRHREIKDIVKEIRINKAKSVFFVDDNLVADLGFAESLFDALKPLGIRWGAQVPLHFARNERLVKLARSSGCKRLFVGVESLNQQSLDEVSRKGRVEEFEKCISTLKRNDILVWAGFIFGFDHDLISDIDKTVDFCIRNKVDVVNFHPLAAFPGTPLYEAKKKELVYDYLINPKQMDIDEMLAGISEGYKRFYSWKNLLPRSFGQMNHPLSWIKYLYLSRGYYKSAS